MREKIKHKIINGIEHKQCGKCKQWKDLNCFSVANNSWDKLACWCKSCMTQYYQDNKEKNQTPFDADIKKIQQLYDICSETNEILGEIYFHIDHIQPTSKGGLHHQDNLQILEAYLNISKHDKYPLTKKEKVKYKGIKI